jgi:hypothetical protein
LETVLKITEGGGNKIYVEKKKRGSSTPVFCFTEYFHQKEIPKGSSFFPPFSPSFLVVVKGDLILTFPNIRTGSSPCIVLWTLFFLFFPLPFSFPSFVEFGRREEKHFLQGRGKKKKKGNKK